MHQLDISENDTYYGSHPQYGCQKGKWYSAR